MGVLLRLAEVETPEFWQEDGERFDCIFAAGNCEQRFGTWLDLHSSTDDEDCTEKQPRIDMKHR